MNKRIVFTLMTVLFLLVNINCGEDPMDDVEDFFSSNEQYTEVCGINMVFHRQWDENQHHNIWGSVDIQNTLDQKAHLTLFDENGYIILEKTLYRRSQNTYDIYIFVGEDITVEVLHMVDYHWETCSESGTVLEL